MLIEYDGNGNLITKYIHGLGIDEPLSMIKNNQTYYYHADGLGSITAITDSSGTIVQKYQYDSFGNITSVLNPNFIQPYTFTGREYDPESGLLFYRARELDSKTGTFTQKDPIGFGGGDVNLYRYVFNSPVNYTDPLGLFGIFGPGLTNIRWPHEPCRDEDDPEDPYIKSLMTPYLKGDKVPGQFGTLGVIIVYGIGSTVYRQGIWTARTITYGTPFLITVDPSLYMMTPEKAEYYKSQKKKK